MPTTLSQILPIDAYLGRRDINLEANRRDELSNINTLSGLLQLQRAVQARQQQEELRTVLSQSGGDPGKAVQALLAAGTPQSLALAAQLRSAFQKPEGQPIGAGGLRLPSGEIIPPAARPTAPREFAPPEILRLQNQISELPPDSPMLPALHARIKLLTERSPGVTVNMPQSSDLMQKPDGSYVRIRIGKNGQVEEIPLGNVRPPLTPGERTKEEKTAESEATIESVKQRVTRMSQLIQGNTAVVGPAGLARRWGETAAGVAAPGIPTPAIDFENEKNLMIADIRKLIEKDPNLSNQERETLSRTLGGGTMQTPGSAIRTLNNVLNFVENKKLSGPSRGAVKRPVTQEEYNALPSGVIYIDPDDGKRYRKR